MGEIKSDWFQGICTVQEDGAGIRYMHVYDRLPREVRDRLKSSSLNICAACVDAEGVTTGMISFIDRIEKRYRIQEEIRRVKYEQQT